MECPSCNAANPVWNRFCGACGGPLPEDEGIPEYPTRHTSVRREIAVVSAGFLLICFAVGLAWYLFFQRGSPASIVRAFIEADRNSDYATEQQYVLSRWDSRIVLSALQTFRQQTGFSPFKQYRVLNTSFNGDTAVVNVEVTFRPAASASPGVIPVPASTQTVPFVLVRQNRDWWIDATQTAAGLAGIWIANGIQQVLPNGLAPPGGVPPIGPNGPMAVPSPPPATGNGISIRQL